MSLKCLFLLGIYETVMDFFLGFWHFIEQTIDNLIKKTISKWTDNETKQ